MASNNNKNEAELVLIPTPGMGHLLSAVELAKLLVRRDHRISVLILVIKIPMTEAILDNFVDSQSRDNPYPTRLTFQTLPPLDNPLPNASSPAFFTTLIELHKPLIKEAVEDRLRADQSPRLAGFILDMFCFTAIEVGNHFNVPSYIFFSSGANYLNLLFYFGSLIDEEGIDICAEFSDPDVELDVPGFENKLVGKIIPGLCLNKEIGSKMTFDISKWFRKSRGIIINTYTELETCGIQALLDQADKGSIPAVYPVGPILVLDKTSRGGSKQEEEESIMEWLDDQPTSSVVFLCFGSMGSFDADQVKEMAKGLENSGNRFLWSLRKPPAVGKVGAPIEHEAFVEALPEGFLERTADRGKIIGWAPQGSILSHEAVGGFVSHCGWNSILEGLWFGVPMATWPSFAEQQLNAFKLVKELGLAVEIRMDYRRDWKTMKGNVMVTAEEIENGVNKLMSIDQEMRNKVKEMKNKGRSTLEDGGSSYNWLGCYIEDVLSNLA